MFGESSHCAGPSTMGVIPKVETRVSEDANPMQNCKKARTSEDFYLFCKYVLDYENYNEDVVKEEARLKSSSPLGSTGSGRESVKSETSGSPRERKESGDTDDDARESVTCFCKKPFAGRPMIQCDSCYTWQHLSCVKIKKSQIPDIFKCFKCRGDRDSVTYPPTSQHSNVRQVKSRVRKRTNSQVE